MKNINILSLILISVLFVACLSPNEPDALTNSEVAGFKVLSKINIQGYAEDAVIKDNMVYIAQGEGGLSIINISNPALPIIQKSIFDGLRGYSKKIALKDKIVYLAANTFGINVVDVNDPANPTVLATNLEMKPAKDVYVFGDFLFTAISEQGVKIADISTAATPDIAGRIQTLAGYSRSNIVTKDSVLITSCGEMGLGFTSIRNIKTGFESFPTLRLFNTDGYCEASALSQDGKYLVAACGNSGLIIFDITDLNNIKEVARLNPGGYANDILINKNFAILSSSNRGVQIISIADIYNPKLLGTIPLQDITGLSIDKQYLVATDESEGMVLIQMPE